MTKSRSIWVLIAAAAFLVLSFYNFAGSPAGWQVRRKARRLTRWKENHRDPSAFSLLGRHFVVHMEHRKDRMTVFTERMAAAGVSNFTVIRGIPHRCPLLGATLAHVAALQLCWASHWVESCVIMEDDFSLREPASASNALIARFTSEVEDWDVLMLSCNLREHAKIAVSNQTVPEYAVRVKRAYSAGGYVVKRAYAEKVASHWLMVNGGYELQKRCVDEFVLDVVWGQLQAKDRWYTMPDANLKTGRVGYQAASFSDIQHRYTDYGLR